MPLGVFALLHILYFRRHERPPVGFRFEVAYYLSAVWYVALTWLWHSIAHAGEPSPRWWLAAMSYGADVGMAALMIWEFLSKIHKLRRLRQTATDPGGSPSVQTPKPIGQWCSEVWREIMHMRAPGGHSARRVAGYAALDLFVLLVLLAAGALVFLEKDGDFNPDPNHALVLLFSLPPAFWLGTRVLALIHDLPRGHAATARPGEDPS